MSNTLNSYFGGTSVINRLNQNDADVFSEVLILQDVHQYYMIV